MQDPALLADAVVRARWTRAMLLECTAIAAEALRDAGLHVQGELVELPVNCVDGYAQARASVGLCDAVRLRSMRLSTVLQMAGQAQHLGVGTLAWEIEPLVASGQRPTAAGKALLANQRLMQLEASISVGSVPELLAHIAQNVQLTPSLLYTKARHLAADLLLALNR